RHSWHSPQGTAAMTWTRSPTCQSVPYRLATSRLRMAPPARLARRTDARRGVRPLGRGVDERHPAIAAGALFRRHGLCHRPWVPRERVVRDVHAGHRAEAAAVGLDDLHAAVGVGPLPAPVRLDDLEHLDAEVCEIYTVVGGLFTA